MNLMSRRHVLLLVEDDPLLMGLYKTAFEKQGLEVEVAHNGEEGLKKIEERMPDMVVLDMLMPGIDGLEVLRRIRSNPKTKDIKVAILTVVNTAEVKEKARALGAVDYLIKSDLELHQIVERVMALLDKVD